MAIDTTDNQLIYYEDTRGSAFIIVSVIYSCSDTLGWRLATILNNVFCVSFVLFLYLRLMIGIDYGGRKKCVYISVWDKEGERVMYGRNNKQANARLCWVRE